MKEASIFFLYLLAYLVSDSLSCKLQSWVIRYRTDPFLHTLLVLAPGDNLRVAAQLTCYL